MARLSGDLEILDGASTTHVTVLALLGELDLANAQEFDEVLQAMCEPTTMQLVLDIGGLRFIDARGIGVIAMRAARLAKEGGSLRIVGASPWHRRVFATIGLDSLLAEGER